MHASCVALVPQAVDRDIRAGDMSDYAALGQDDALRGVLLKGPSGSGKSSLALELISRGGALVADDRVEITRRDGRLWARPPETISGLIEARGLGVLRAKYVAEVQLHVIVDMATLETERLPGHLIEQILGISLARINRVDSPFFAAALIQYVKGGAVNPDDGLSSL